MVINDYAYLPVHLVDYRDGGMELKREDTSPSAAKTESVLLIGTATDGPVGEPVAVDSQTYTLFGSSVNSNGSPNGASLVKAFEECYKTGCRDIRMLRLSGNPAVAHVKGATKQVNNSKYKEVNLGNCTGNKKSNSTFVLDEAAESIVDIIINGNKLTKDQYEYETVEEKHNILVDNNNNKYNVSDTQEVYKYNGKYIDTTGDDITGWFEIITGSNITLDNGDSMLTQPIVKVAIVDNTVIELEEREEVINRISKVSIKDDVCNCGSYVLIRLKIGDETNDVSSNSSGNFVANGEALTFELEDVPDDIANVTVYIGNKSYSSKDTVQDIKIFSLEDKKLTINTGRHTPSGDSILIRYRVTKKEEVTGEITLTTAFGGVNYNTSKYIVSKGSVNGEKILSIVKPESKKSQPSEKPMTFSSFDYPTLALMAKAINANSNNGGLFEASVSKGLENEPTSKLNETTPDGEYFMDGDDGVLISKQEIYEKLSGKRDENYSLIEPGIFQILENYTVDNIVLCDGIYADDELNGRWENFAYELALTCTVLSMRNHQTHGYIATSSPDSTRLKDINSHLNNIVNFSNSYIMRKYDGEPIYDSNHEVFDIGKFITVVVGPELTFMGTELGAYSCNSAAAVAGFISQLNSSLNSSGTYTFPTNKRIAGVLGLKYIYSNTQANALAYKRFLTLSLKDDGSVVIQNAPTAALDGSDYAMLSTVGAVKKVVNEVRLACDPYLGQPNTTQQQNAMAGAIEKILMACKDTGIISDYDFNIICTQMDKLLGKASIELTLRPAQELRELTTIVKLKPSL